jgi:hypothetical protein
MPTVPSRARARTITQISTMIINTLVVHGCSDASLPQFCSTNERVRASRRRAASSRRVRHTSLRLWKYMARGVAVG